jgi:hypothetical protein
MTTGTSTGALSYDPPFVRALCVCEGPSFPDIPSLRAPTESGILTLRVYVGYLYFSLIAASAETSRPPICYSRARASSRWQTLVWLDTTAIRSAPTHNLS